MKQWLKKNRFVVILAGIGIVCFFIYGFLAFTAPKEIFNSPDETANYVFSSAYSRGSMAMAEPDNLRVQGIIHPRSATVNEKGDIVPGYFLGLPIILGFLAKIFGSGIISFVTPIVSAITPLFFYWALKNIFEKKVAFISALLLYFHPIFIYYSAKSLMPNVLFIDFLIISLAFILNAGYKKGFKNQFRIKPILFYLLAGAFLGLAMSIRPSEFFWVVFLYLILFLFGIKKVNWPGLILGLLAAAAAQIPTLLENMALYGGYLKLGYNTRLLGVELDQGGVLGLLKSIFSWSTVFPFGIKLAASANVFINYFWRFLGWYHLWLLPGLAASVVYLKFNWSRKIVYAIGILGVGAYLILYYGAYVFQDNINSSQISIGTSYLRYWLPLMIMILPVMAYSIYAVWRLSEKFGLKIKAAFTILFFLILNLYTFQIVFAETNESLLAVKENLKKYDFIRENVLAVTEEDAIIICDRSDKIFFPKRQVIVFQENYEIFPLINRIVSRRPVYFYTMLPPEDLNYLSQNKIAKRNWQFFIINRFDNFYLYKLIGDKD
ncbi:MAG TPA: glycosyltransferase family 39 protein [Candidatus Bipolaricaulota bacterium]|nr:glycosyltransferase family 39 protein [Candidatus Bipolaricaulota bacterium]